MSVHTLQIEIESCLGVLKMSESEQDQPDGYLMLTLLIQQPLFTEYRPLSVRERSVSRGPRDSRDER